MLHVIILPTCIYNFYKQSYNHLHMYNEPCFCIYSFTQCSPFITHLIYNADLDMDSVMLWFQKFFYYGILQWNYRKMKWSFSYDSFVKLSLYNTINL